MFRESKTLRQRQKAPNRSFMSNNFLIRREILSKFPFDERITQYGHEDTLLGFVLKKNGIEITHINNPVLNGELEINSEYLRKNAESIKNLGAILEYVEYDQEFIKDIGLLQFYQKIKPAAPFFRFAYRMLGPAIRFFLRRGWISLKLFNFFKLGLFLDSKFKKELL